VTDLVVVGGGLAGSEAAWQAAERGYRVTLFEMRPQVPTGAHTGDKLGELVCSNSLGSNLPDRASGILKAELRRLGSLLLECAGATALPAGSALAVDREAFSSLVTERVQGHPRIEIVRDEVTDIPDAPAIIASGPLTSPRLAEQIRAFSGEEHLYFFDAIAPIVEAGSINLEIAFRASRYNTGESQDGDYINCPLDRGQYEAFVEALIAAERIELRDFEQGLLQGVRAGLHHFFEGCLPVEILALRGPRSLAFGPMRPVGLTDPRTGKRPHAVVQLRQDNLAGSLYNMVGFQTNLKFRSSAGSSVCSQGWKTRSSSATARCTEIHSWLRPASFSPLCNTAPGQTYSSPDRSRASKGIWAT
jgi:methylenetetrahydrofolate--tRNA-(uracil-5-)-methyltransferase